MIPVWQMLDLALQHYRKGEWQQAEQLYLQVLDVDPNQVDALHILAAITGQTGRDEQAIEYLRAVLRIRPGSAEAHNNLGMVFITRRRLPEAVASFQEAVRFNPNFVAAHNNLGNALRELGRQVEAAETLQEAVRLGPGQAVAHYNLGLAWLAQGKLPAAVASLQQAVRLKPDHADAHLHLGVALGKQGKHVEAAASFQQVLRLQPDHVEARVRLGLAPDSLGKLEVSTAGCQPDVRPRPEDAEAHVAEGMALVAQGKLAEAVCCYQQALLCRPDFAEAHYNMGSVLRELGQVEEAEVSLEQALRLEPGYAGAHYNLGVLLQKQGRLEAALARYQQALRLEPENAQIHLRVANIFKSQGRLDEALDAFRYTLRLNPGDAHVHSALVFTFHYHPRYDARAIYEECLRWNQQHAEPLKGSIQRHTNCPDPERRLRVGYVSPDFREHSCTSFTVPLLANHDHRVCEIFCYADVEHPDAFTERVRGYADVWRNTLGLSDQQVADMIRNDQIDILVDLAMHTANNRLPAFARKPAPVQAAWLAYPGTTGLSTMDYRLTDPYFDPPGLFDACYSEESIRLPDTFWCYDPLADQPVNALPAGANGFITFGCLNNFCKVNDGCLELWARVLQRVPQSRLLLLAPRDPARERVLAKLEQEGIAPARVEFVAKLPRPEYFGLYHQVDLALDPLPCNGGTTTLDAFWMGIPTLTLIGKTVVGRAGWSQLCNLGLKDLAAETPEEFVELAVRLAGDLPRLGELRATLRQRMQQSPLMDGQRFARHMEQAYRQMWQRWCQGRRRHDPA
jgi:predicted O-linked N-acetylglucosamine transferase (SPINDLY family)